MARQRARDRRPRKRVDDVVTLDKEYVEQMKKAEGAEGSEAGSAPSAAHEENKSADTEELEVSHPDPDEGAHVFGEQGKAWMTVEIAEDHQQATLTALSFAGQKMKRQAVADALKEIYHIQRGFQKKTLKEAIRRPKRKARRAGHSSLPKANNRNQDRMEP